MLYDTYGEEYINFLNQLNTILDNIMIDELDLM